MRTVDFSTILFQAIQLCGLDREDFNDSTFMQLRDFASSRLRTVWESDKWAELINIDEIDLHKQINTTQETETKSGSGTYFVGANDITFNTVAGSSPIPVGSIITINNASNPIGGFGGNPNGDTGSNLIGNHTVIQSGVSGLVKIAKPSSFTHQGMGTLEWTVTTTTTTTTTKTDNYFVVPDYMGEIFGIYNINPNETSRNKLLNYSFLSVNGEYRCIVNSPNFETVFVEYRMVPPQIYGMPWDNATTYQENAQVYFDTGSASGSYFPAAGSKYAANFYTCVDTSLNNSPATHPAKWSKVKIPYIFANYLARAIQSDYLRSENMQELAQVAEQEANAMLALEVDKITRQQGQTFKINFHNPY